jgi:hypothetical protein
VLDGEETVAEDYLQPLRDAMVAERFHRLRMGTEYSFWVTNRLIRRTAMPVQSAGTVRVLL